MKRNNIFWILTGTVFLSLLLPTLVQEGMFLDGITYSAISKNMANGLGSIWNPHYTNILYPSFHEHPPLVFIIQSSFFNVFGDAFYTERIFSLFIALLTGLGITLCWRLFTDKTELKEYGWLPVLLWLSVPLVSWSYKNNLLENTMGVFTVFAVFFIIKSIIESRIIFLLIGSVLIVLAFLSKGFTGTFPIVVPIVFAFIYKPNRHTILYTVYLILFTVLVSYLFFIVFPELKNNITCYLQQQLLPSLNNQREITTTNRVSIILNLVIELTLPIILLAYFAIKQRLKNGKVVLLKNETALLFLLIALCASLPLMISLKQRKFYLIPSIPFYILSISFFVVPFLKQKLDTLSNTTLKWMKRSSYTVASIVLILSVFQFGKFSRDEEKLTDIYVISNAIPEGTVISTTKDLWQDWSLVAYMSRVGNISLDCDNKHEYLLIENNTIDPGLPEEYEKMDLKLKKYVLLKMKK
jgi:hypothetical protein